jgi:hypothetical protein
VRVFTNGRKWTVAYHLIDWSYISLGFHISLADLNVEIHLPFGFIRAGRTPCTPNNNKTYIGRTLGWTPYGSKKFKFFKKGF